MTKSNIIGIHGGHAVIGSRGAKGYLDEVNVNRKLVKYIKEYLRKHGYVVKDCSVKSGTQNSVLNGIKNKALKNNTDVNFSIHLNSGGGNGIEIYPPTSHEIARSRSFLTALCNLTGFKNRGVKECGKFYVNRHLKKCYLLEVGIVDSAIDKHIYDKKGIKNISYNIARCIIQYL